MTIHMCQQVLVMHKMLLLFTKKSNHFCYNSPLKQTPLVVLLFKVSFLTNPKNLCNFTTLPNLFMTFLIQVALFRYCLLSCFHVEKKLDSANPFKNNVYDINRPEHIPEVQLLLKQ